MARWFIIGGIILIVIGLILYFFLRFSIGLGGFPEISGLKRKTATYLYLLPP